MGTNEIILTLAGVIAAMAAYIVKLHMVDRREKKDDFKSRSEEIKMMTEALTSTKHAIQNNTEMMKALPDALFDKIGKATKR